ncbi:MAG: restriction endonuclease subunit S [Thermoanaerobaculia bacterium]|nr:restriction endonuclease subunit S [Thermoanaerobaculia bacterium]
MTYGVVKPGPEDPDHGVLFIRGGDIGEGRVLTEQLRTITREVSKQYRRTQLRGGEIVVSLVGNPGQVAIVPESLRGANIARQAGLVRLRKDVDTRFVKYFLSSRAGQEALGSHSLGSVQQVINLRDLRTVRVPVPPLAEQRAIAHILGTLDDKIELNRRMSETLKAMARALFKSWFVDFEPVRARAERRDPGLPEHLSGLFPDSFEDSAMGEIPKGWEVGPLGDVVEHLRDNEDPLDSPDQQFRHFSIPAFDDGQWPTAELGASIKSQKTRVPPGVVLLSKLNPEIERVWLVDVEPGDRAVCSTEFLVLSPRSPHGRAFAYCAMKSPTFRQELEGLVTGTSKSHQRAQPTAILPLAITKPRVELTVTFERIANPLIARALGCRRESRTLAALRDALLPRLVSGELRLKRSGTLSGAVA